MTQAYYRAKESVDTAAFEALASQNEKVRIAFTKLETRYSESHARQRKDSYRPPDIHPAPAPYEDVVAHRKIGLSIGTLGCASAFVVIALVGRLIYDVIRSGTSATPETFETALSNPLAYIAIAFAGICLACLIVGLIIQFGKTRLKQIEPPDSASDAPLIELAQLAERTSNRLRATFRYQLVAVLCVGVTFLVLIGLSVFMVSKNEALYATVFGSQSVSMIILTRWKWQPFERINEARRLADNADAIALGLRLRLRTISEIHDPKEREAAQWNAVQQYIALSP
jgi:hypothetical protein